MFADERKDRRYDEIIEDTRGHRLDPRDLCARHVSPVVNLFMKLALPWLQPVLS
jgi:hypothetical protein